jgi:hypothetical protein
MKSKRTANKTSARARAQWWKLPDAELLNLRFCDLKLTLVGTNLEQQVQQLYGELEKRGIRFRPHMWLAEEWFSPDGIPGVAIPFFLAHPRLRRLERRMMRQVEGGNHNWLMRILRHEAGHAIDTAYRLRRRVKWQEIFGSATKPYPTRYVARPGSRRYVQHLGEWYAQSHPTEDFAETFAVWLKPKSDWRHSYAAWPARKKLIYVHELMAELGDTAPRVYVRRHVESLADNRRTLGEHYAERRKHQGVCSRGAVDELLLRAFTQTPRRKNIRAATLLRTKKLALVSSVVHDLQRDRYSVFQVLRIVILRAEQLRLHLRGTQTDAVRTTQVMLAKLVQLYNQGKSPQLSL